MDKGKKKMVFIFERLVNFFFKISSLNLISNYAKISYRISEIKATS